jgi:hypothetical protein
MSAMHLAEPLTCTRLSQNVEFLYRLTPVKANARVRYFMLPDDETKVSVFAALDKREGDGDGDEFLIDKGR